MDISMLWLKVMSEKESVDLGFGLVVTGSKVNYTSPRCEAGERSTSPEGT